MEHSCPKCGAQVEDGTPFCPQCNAPQIRVQSSAVAPATPPMPPGTPDEVQPPAEPLQHGAIPHHDDRPFAPLPPPPSRPSGTRISSARRAALWAGVIAGVGSLVPFPPFIFLCMIAAGGMSVAFYSRYESGSEVRASSGFKIGSLAGLFGFLMYACLSSFTMFSETARSALRTEMAARIKEAIATSNNNQTAAMMRKFGEQLSTTSGLVTLFIFALAFLGVLFVLFGGIGGAVGASLFGRRSH